jgi:excisionase family DNA binding protein
MFVYPPLVISENDQKIYRELLQKLLSRISDPQKLTIQILDAELEEPVEIPANAYSLIIDALKVFAAGEPITFMPENAELTPDEAAEILSVSRPFVIKLLEHGSIPYRKLGSFHRIRAGDVLKYKEESDQRREVILDQLVADAQEQGMYNLVVHQEGC